MPDATARVWIDGRLTTTQGADRLFVTAPLERGYTYTYLVKAAWNQDGHDVMVEREVQVTPGHVNKVYITKADLRVGSTSTTP